MEAQLVRSRVESSELPINDSRKLVVGTSVRRVARFNDDVARGGVVVAKHGLMPPLLHDGLFEFHRAKVFVLRLNDDVTSRRGGQYGVERLFQFQSLGYGTEKSWSILEESDDKLLEGSCGKVRT